MTANFLIDRLTSDDVIESNFAWVCRLRNGYSPNSDIWELRTRWDILKLRLTSDLAAGTFLFSSLRTVGVAGNTLEVWSALDALVLKALTIVLTPALEPLLSRRCYHLKGHGGAKAAVRAVAAQLPAHPFVYRSDAQSYYASMDQEILYHLLQRFVTEKPILRLLWSYLRRTVYDDGVYREIQRGISLGCSLSPLMGALYLQPLDERMERIGCFYARFMDDWVVLATSRWKLRTAIRETNEVLEALRLKQHPLKTTIGRTADGFDFLGYTIYTDGVGVAASSIRQLAKHVTRLYEQDAAASRIGDYVRRWMVWTAAGLTTKKPSPRAG